MSNGTLDSWRFGARSLSKQKWGPIAIFALVLWPVIAFAGSDGGKMKKTEPRTLVQTVKSTYAIYQVDKEIGKESVTRSSYSDNTVEFKATANMALPNGGGVSTEASLLLEEESYFPIEYHSVRSIEQAGTTFDSQSDIEWYANVAVVHLKSASKDDTTNVVTPTGAAVVDVNLAHHLYQLLKWYDVEAGGVQGFNILDPGLGRLITSSLRLLAKETITVGGEEIVASRFDFNRDRSTFKLFVDGEGRIVKVDQGYMVYELADWTESPVQE